MCCVGTVTGMASSESKGRVLGKAMESLLRKVMLEVKFQEQIGVYLSPRWRRTFLTEDIAVRKVMETH